MTHTHTPPISLRNSADLAELLPYLFDVQPQDSLAAFGIYSSTNGCHGHAGATMRIDLPGAADTWKAAADHAAHNYIYAHEQRGDALPQRTVLYLCATPQPDERPHQTVRRLAPLADRYQRAFADHDMPVLDVLCITEDRYWSYLHPDACPPEGSPLPDPDTPGPVTTAAVVNGIDRAAHPRDIARAFAPLTGDDARRSAEALDRTIRSLNARSTHTPGTTIRRQLRPETRTLITSTLTNLATTNILPDEETTARLILGLQDRNTRDWAFVRDDVRTAHRLWAHLARNCTTRHRDLRPPLLTLYAWTSWSAGDTRTARVAVRQALKQEPGHAMAEILLRALTHGVDLHAMADAMHRGVKEAGI